MHRHSIAFLLLCLTAAPVPAAAQESIQGKVTRIESASRIQVQGVPLLLEGIAAPGPETPLGREALGALRGLTWEARVVCVLPEGAGKGSRVGRCYFWDQTKPEAIRAELGEAERQPDHEAWLLYGDLAARLVALGLARDCPSRSGGRYSALEQPEALEVISLPDDCRN
jgi:hypothetical protein